MQTVQFQCGKCRGLMAVVIDHLGRQVRCPHCQAVVVAVAAEPALAIAPMATPAPLLAVSSSGSTTERLNRGEPASAVDASRAVNTDPVGADASAEVDSTFNESSFATGPLDAMAAGKMKRSGTRGGHWFILLVFMPLVSYAILATIAVVILWSRLQERR